MRLWTAMLGAWLAAGTAAAEGGKASDRARPEAGTPARPVAECCLDGSDRRTPPAPDRPAGGEG